MKTVREFLTELNISKGLPINDKSLGKTLTNYGKIVYHGEQDTQRWYICETVVAQIGDTYIRYEDYIITGDNSMSDMDLHYNIDEAQIVERKERQVTEVYYEAID